MEIVSVKFGISGPRPETFEILFHSDSSTGRRFRQAKEPFGQAQARKFARLRPLNKFDTQKPITFVSIRKFLSSRFILPLHSNEIFGHNLSG